MSLRQIAIITITAITFASTASAETQARPSARAYQQFARGFKKWQRAEAKVKQLHRQVKEEHGVFHMTRWMAAIGLAGFFGMKPAEHWLMTSDSRFAALALLASIGGAAIGATYAISGEHAANAERLHQAKIKAMDHALRSGLKPTGKYAQSMLEVFRYEQHKMIEAQQRQNEAAEQAAQRDQGDRSKARTELAQMQRALDLAD